MRQNCRIGNPYWSEQSTTYERQEHSDRLRSFSRLEDSCIPSRPIFTLVIARRPFVLAVARRARTEHSRITISHNRNAVRGTAFVPKPPAAAPRRRALSDRGVKGEGEKALLISFP